MQYFRVKNFQKLQYYKERRPPWVKLDSRVVDSSRFSRLPDTSKLHLMLIWLLVNKSGNCLPYNAEWIKYSIRVTEDVDLDILVKIGFIELIKE